MEFLKILGDELYKQLETAINAHNGNEANKDNQIKLANLATGEYVGKGKYEAEVVSSQGKDAEIENYKKAIADLQKANKGNEDIQQRISQLEAENAQLKAEQKETKIQSAIKVGLLSEHCSDVDYVTYKLMESLKEKGETLELDENDSIKGWTDKLSGLKTQLPAWFGNGGADENQDGYKPLDNKGLPKDFDNKSITKEQFLKMSVDQRIALKQKDEKLYKNLKG